MQVELWQAACCAENGAGGWSAVLSCQAANRSWSGGSDQADLGRMQLQGVVSSLRALRPGCQVTAYVDPNFLLPALSGDWSRDWQRNGWRTLAGSPVQDHQLWHRLLSLSDRHQIHWQDSSQYLPHTLLERAWYLARCEMLRRA